MSLKESISFLFKDSLLYGVGNAITKFLAVLTVPILTRVLSKEDFGSIDAVLSFTTIFAGLVILGQDSSIARFFYEQEEDPAYRKKIASSGFVIQLGMMLVLGLILFFCINDIGKLFYSDKTSIIYYWKIGLIVTPGYAFLSFSMNIFKWTFQRNKFLFITIGSSLVNVLLTLYLVLYLKWGIMGAIVPSAISTNVFGVLGVIMNRKYISFRYQNFDFTIIRKMLSYGFPFMLVMIIGFVLPSVDRFFLLRYSDLSQIAVYSIGVKLGSLLGLGVYAFQIAFAPYAFSVWKKEGAAENFRHLFRIYFLLFSFFAVILTCFGTLIITAVASNKYEASFIVLPPLLLAQVFQGMLEFTLLGIAWSKKTIYNFIISVLTIGILCLCNFVLVPYFTLIGAACSFLLSKILQNVFAYYISNKYYKIPIRFKDIAIVLTTVGMCFFCAYLNYFYDRFLFKILTGLSMILFPYINYLLLFSRDEKARITVEIKSLNSRLFQKLKINRPTV